MSVTDVGFVAAVAPGCPRPHAFEPELAASPLNHREHAVTVPVTVSPSLAVRTVEGTRMTRTAGTGSVGAHSVAGVAATQVSMKQVTVGLTAQPKKTGGASAAAST